ncbi:MAG: glycosyltransferase [Evtepia gabavorous]
MSEADEVCVLDTGSTDGTPQRLSEQLGPCLVQVITPWRFDVARNQSLELVPEDADLCVCTDLDEVFQPGWRER